MEMFQEAMRMWLPFQTGSDAQPGPSGEVQAGEAKPAKSGGKDAELDAMRQPLRDMQKAIETIATKKD